MLHDLTELLARNVSPAHREVDLVSRCLRERWDLGDAFRERVASRLSRIVERGSDAAALRVVERVLDAERVDLERQRLAVQVAGLLGVQAESVVVATDEELGAGLRNLLEVRR